MVEITKDQVLDALNGIAQGNGKQLTVTWERGSGENFEIRIESFEIIDGCWAINWMVTDIISWMENDNPIITSGNKVEQIDEFGIQLGGTYHYILDLEDATSIRLHDD